MKRKKRINDDGFSILEAMVAIVILSIIFIPVTNSFISSIKASKETKIMQEATQTAQLVMEDVKRQTFNKLMTDYTVGEGIAIGETNPRVLTGDEIKQEKWSSLTLKKKFKFENNGCCDFDVDVNLSRKSTKPDTNKLDDINSVEMKKIYSLEAPSSYTLNAGDVPDYIISDLMAKSHGSKSYVEASVIREIKVSLKEDSSTGNTNITSKVIYHCDLWKSEGLESTTNLNSKVKNVFVFYKAIRNLEDDILTIDNEAKAECNLYLVGEGKSNLVVGYKMRFANCTNVDKIHVVSTVPTWGDVTMLSPSSDAEFAPDKEAKTRRYEITVTVKKKVRGRTEPKVYSEMVSTRGE